jgi:hypothetical protein
VKACCVKEVLIEREACAEVAYKYASNLDDRNKIDLSFIAGYILQQIQKRSAPVVEPDEDAVLLKVLEAIVKPTYGTELCNTDAENNEILTAHFWRHIDIARKAIAAYRASKVGK